MRPLLKLLRIMLGILLLSPLSVPATQESSTKISLNFQQIKLRELLQLLTQDLKKNIILSPHITGSLGLTMTNVPRRQVLELLLQTHNLAKYETAQLLWIGPRQELNDQWEVGSIQPTVVPLKYTPAPKLAQLLGTIGCLSKTGKIGAQDRTNQLIISDHPTNIGAINTILQQLDRTAPQILIEARIVNVDERFIQKLGVEFGIAQVKHPAPGPGSHKLATPSAQNHLNLTLAKLSNGALLDLELAALESSGHGKIISSPKLLTNDRQAAFIESGAEIPYQEKTKDGATSIAFKKAVLSLTVTPEVMHHNLINLLLQLNQDQVSQLNINGVPAIDTRKIHTQVSVQDGETIVLGGIYEWAASKSRVGVPILSKIPLLGICFQHQETRMERKALLLFITPKILK